MSELSLVEKFVLPFPGASISSLALLRDGADQVLEIEGTRLSEIDETIRLRFLKTRAFRHLEEAHRAAWQLKAYDKLCEVMESEWVMELKQNTKPHAGAHWILRHFVIYVDTYGSYEFVAQDALMESEAHIGAVER